MITFGLLNGMILQTVLLSLIGPVENLESQQTVSSDSSTNKIQNEGKGRLSPNKVDI